MIDEIKRRLEEDFIVYDTEKLPDGVRFYLHPKNRDIEKIRSYLLPLTLEYTVEMKYLYGEHILEIRKRVEKERIWINLLLFAATFVSTTLMGMNFYGEFNIAGGVLFSIAIMFVLGSHEMGHYFAARRWRMRTTLPYFIPAPTFIGTLGAVIRHKGPIPSRSALFDVGVSGPLVGIAASVIVACIGLTLPFHPEVRGGEMLIIGTPLLFDALIVLTGFNDVFIHPIAIAGWVGMFVTFLNLVPAGQLDGGHVLRAMIGRKAEFVSKSMPLILIAMGGVIELVYQISNSIWIFWGLIVLFFSMQRHPEPIDDSTPLDSKRFVVGMLTFGLSILCFTPVPIKLQSL
jgi:membrane-associated protease RseP (regulator of RpoE activity)